MAQRNETRDIRLFGGAFTVLCGGIGVWLLLGGKTVPGTVLVAAAAYFLAGAALLPVILRPPYLVWMRFAFALGWVNSRILLGVFYALVLTPVGLVSRLMRRDGLDRRLDRAGESYWRERAGTDVSRERYERQH